MLSHLLSLATDTQHLTKTDFIRFHTAKIPQALLCKIIITLYDFDTFQTGEIVIYFSMVNDSLSETAI